MLDFTVTQVTELTVKRAILWHLIGLSWFKIHLRRPLLTSSVKDIFKLTAYENHSEVTFEHEGAISSSPKPNLKVNFYIIHVYMQLGPLQMPDFTLQIIAEQTFVNSNKKVVAAFLKSDDFTRKVGFVQ